MTRKDNLPVSPSLAGEHSGSQSSEWQRSEQNGWPARLMALAVWSRMSLGWGYLWLRSSVYQTISGERRAKTRKAYC